jgi:lysophospholipase L1-like esterase
LHEEFNVLNLGISGTTAQRARESSYWTFPHLGVAKEVDFDVAIVQLGSNDAKTRNWDTSKYQADLRNMLKELAKGHPHAKFIVSVPPPVEANRFTIEADVVAKPLPDAIHAVQASPDLSLDLVNMQAAFADARQPLQDLLLEDGVHPNEVGYGLMSRAAEAAVRRALSPPP